MQSKYIYIGIVAAIFTLTAINSSQAQAEAEELKVVETPTTIEIHPAASPSGDPKTFANNFDPLKYTLGAEDVVEITVMRHPEFSGIYPINQEGKLQYKFVGDIEVTGLTKLELETKLKEIISNYVISPEINVTVTEYKSKIYYVLGEVSTPGKYYMRSEAIPLREAVFQAGLPTQAAAMRKCRIITPNKNGDGKVRNVDIYSLLYGGNLKKNIDLHPGDILYVPSTIMAKVIRVINPVASTIGVASSGPSNASAGRTAVDTLVK